MTPGGAMHEPDEGPEHAHEELERLTSQIVAAQAGQERSFGASSPNTIRGSDDREGDRDREVRVAAARCAGMNVSAGSKMEASAGSATSPGRGWPW
jgi:hypothetical protein